MEMGGSFIKQIIGAVVVGILGYTLYPTINEVFQNFTALGGIIGIIGTIGPILYAVTVLYAMYKLLTVAHK